MKTLIRAMCVLLSIVCFVKAETRLASKQLDFDWPANSAQVPKLEIGAVEKLLNSLLMEADPPVTVESFRFAALDSGPPFLIAVVDGSGRGFFNYVNVVRCNSSSQRCSFYLLASDMPHNLSSEVVDVDHDGLDEIVLQSVVYWDGIRTLPVYVFSIMKLVKAEFEDVSKTNAEYYTNHLLNRDPEGRKAAFVKELESGTDLSDEETGQKELFQAQDRFRRHFYERNLLGKPDAGLSDAISWSASTDIAYADLAIRTLTGMQSKLALALLKKLATNNDPEIQSAASEALQSQGTIKRHMIVK